MNKPPRLDLGASSASRWTVCTASPQFILENHHRIPENRDTAYSLEGTLAHAVCEALLTNKPTPLGATAEMERHAQGYREFCRSLSAPGAAEFVETKVPLWYYPGRNAIVDYASVTADQVTNVDYKYGPGVPVDSFENKQLAIYARCFIETIVLGLGTHDITDDTKIVMAIYQPRYFRTKLLEAPETDGEGTGDAEESGDDDEEEVSTAIWRSTWGELRDWTEQNIAATAHGLLAGTQERVFSPSDKTCQFCPASQYNFCTARARQLLGKTALADLFLASPEVLAEGPDFVIKGFTPPELLDDAHRQAALAMAKPVIKYLNQVLKFEKLRAVSNKEAPPGWKLVEGRGSRQWADEAQAAKFLKPKLKDQTFEKKLISVAQAEKLLKHEPLSPRAKNKLESLIVRREGKPTLVPESDKRPSLMAAANDFQQLTDDL